MMIHGAAARPENFRMFWRETVRQMVDIGVGSFLIVAVISVFIGAVTAVQDLQAANVVVGNSRPHVIHAHVQCIGALER